MKNLSSRSIIFGTLALLVVAGLVLDELGALVPLEGLFLQLTTPILRLVDGITERVIGTGSSLRDLRNLREENRQLTSLVDQLMIENVRLKEIEAQNEDLRRKLDFTETHPQYTLKAAEVRGRVIGSEPNNFMSILIIDVGKRAGIRVGMPVVTERGLVGHIRAVGPNWAKVLLIIDPSNSVAALIQASRLQGIVSGRLGEDLMMDYVPQEGQIAVGEMVLTSGTGGNYPKGLVIGQIVEVVQNDVATFQQAIVRPSVDFEQIETVLVLTSFEPIDIDAALNDNGQTIEDGGDEVEPELTPTPDQRATPTP
ncbi:MAG: rod shape-determining protein MreC [Anaerolineae bacterium]|nr:rod shape-determining protein MreC [Anaerolineae bacterium]